MINNLIKFLIVFVMAFNVFAGGDDRDEAYYENLDQELAAFEAKLIADQAADEMMAEIEREAALAAFQQKLEDERAAAAAATAKYRTKVARDAAMAKSSAAYQSKLAREAEMAARMAELMVEKEIAAFEAKLLADEAAVEMMAEIEREMALAAFQQKLADEKAAAAAATAAYRDSLIEAELAAFEAQLEAELAAQQMMAEIEREMALAAFQQKLEDERAAAAAATAAYRASLEDEVIGEIVVEDEVIEVTEAAHEACKYALGLSDANIALFESALADGSLFNKGPQSSNGTEFGASRWDAYANCVSNYVNPF